MKNKRFIWYILIGAALVALFILGRILVHLPAGGSITDSKLSHSIEAATRFLLQKIRSGSYVLSCKASDGSPCPVDGQGHNFAAYFIVDAIRPALKSEDVKTLLDRINRENRHNTWGYSASAPIDSDDTAFVMRTLKLLGKPIERQPLDRFFVGPAKAYRTFSFPDSLNKIVYRPSEKGNKGCHPEVNTNIYTLFEELKQEKQINYDLIRQSQAEDGHWRSYFYPSHYYNTYMSLRLVSKHKNFQIGNQKAVDYIISNQNTDGSWGKPSNAYETALALNGLAQCDIFSDTYSKGIRYLLARQHQDGFWDSQKVIWEFVFRDEPEIIWQAIDINHVITTSLSVKALSAYNSK